MKNVLLVMLSGVLAGIVIASLVVPPLLGWYAEPGGLPKGAQVQAVVNIPEVIRYATSKLLLWQAIAGGLGGVVGLAGFFVMRARGSSRPEPRPDADQTPAR